MLLQQDGEDISEIPQLTSRRVLVLSQATKNRFEGCVRLSIKASTSNNAVTTDMKVYRCQNVRQMQLTGDVCQVRIIKETDT